MNSWLNNNGTFLQIDNGTVTSDLPVGTYLIAHSDRIGFFLKEQTDLNVPVDLYGNTMSDAKHIIDWYTQSTSSTGVLLSGLKGTGKTLLTKVISSQMALQYQVPTIIVNTGFTSDSFFEFIGNIKQRAVILFDEFDTHYNEDDDQPLLLSFLDGLFSTNKLIMFTTNNSNNIDNRFLDRPGRIRYHLTYGKLSTEITKQYLEKNLNDKSKIELISQVVETIDKLNFDILKAIVDEINFFGCSIHDCMEILNISNIVYVNGYFDRQLFVDNVLVDDDHMYFHNRGDYISELEDEKVRIRKPDEKEISIKFTIGDIVAPINLASFSYVKVIDGIEYKLVCTKIVYNAKTLMDFHF